MQWESYPDKHTESDSTPPPQTAKRTLLLNHVEGEKGKYSSNMGNSPSTRKCNEIVETWERIHAQLPPSDSQQCPSYHAQPSNPAFPSSSSIPRQPESSQTSVSMRITNYVAQYAAKDSNLVFSPPSIQLLLGLVAAGATGPTKDQVLSFLNCESVSKLNHLASELISTVLADGSAYGGPKLSFANGVRVDNRLPLKPVFKQIASNNYKASCEHVDFQIKADQVAHKVNSWVEKSTNGLIKDILPTGSVDRTTRLILANALYFKGVWKQKFDLSRTRDLDFHLLNGGSVKVPFMSTTTKQYICAFNGFKVLCLRYSQGRDNRQFSMYIFLPEARDGLPSLMQIASSQPGFLEQHLPHCQADVHICMIPRFKFSFGFEVSKTLKQLGLVLPFSEGGLTEMVDSSLGANLFVSRIFHKSFIEVNEEGTEAAAAPAAVITLKSLDLTNKFEFIADHPFLFFIREDTTGTLLFAGHVLNPLSQN
ncbi:hypothetical protein Cgig2_010315 [Carnegiea gigantea]|uniref:Serpin domain-containing protein n=1 Tax=Carnegiea gigantea TaxID=171969 RepID=A0A9Q1QJJ1_9CARY|nr:hypothetical protein Cgig2_010315 [Carnegiea gigantea]